MIKHFIRTNSFIIYTICRQIDHFSTRCVIDNTIFYEVCLILLNGMTESEIKHN